MINWVNFMHLYQPPGQEADIFHRVARESYFEIAKFFDRFDRLNLTMNLSGSLLEQFIYYRYDSLLEEFRRAFEAGELEISGSAMYHPILPLLPESEIERQILLDDKIKRGIFGDSYRRQGFYFPEMAYSRKVADVLERLGFRWMILDEISGTGKLGGVDTGRVYRLKGSDLRIIFRDRVLSSSFVPEMLMDVSEDAEGGRSIITATDGELYGHHHRDFYAKTRQVADDRNIRSWKASEFIDMFGKGGLAEIEPVPSSWESREEELERGVAYPFWRSPDNEIQRRLWEFSAFVLETVEGSRRDPHYDIARAFADKGISSCHFWAASGKESPVFHELIWNPDAVERGNAFLIRAVRSLEDLPSSFRLEGERMFREISELIWGSHWKKFYEMED